METDQALEWFAAQQITISEDLVAAAKHQLAFLATVDKHRALYEGPILDRAIHRYKAYWLPLLAKFIENGATKGFLVVPLDIEWIWHVHRLNPVQYKEDCEKLFGKILDNKKVKSSLEVRPESRDLMAKMWDNVFPKEPFNLDLTTDSAQQYKYNDKGITYDLVAAVDRQSSFYYHVSGATMKDDRFLEDALARYKGFLHLVRKNPKSFHVPTYDIDLLWHSHQLQPVSYCKDMVALLGKLLEHDDDTDSGRTRHCWASSCKDMVPEKKLDDTDTGRTRHCWASSRKDMVPEMKLDDTDTGRTTHCWASSCKDIVPQMTLDDAFSETTKQWESLYGRRYWKAGAMFKGYKPSPLLVSPYQPKSENPNKATSPPGSNNYINLVQSNVVEVLLQVVGVKNVPETQKGNLFVAFRKQQHDFFLSGSSILNIQSETEEKHVASFQCEATGDLVLTLVADSRLNFARSIETIGTTSISIDKLVGSKSTLFLQDWLQLRACQPSESAERDTNPISILVAVSVSVPVPAPYVFYMIKGTNSSCFFRHPFVIPDNYWTHFVHENGNETISLKIRDSIPEMGENEMKNKRVVIGMTRFNRKPHLFAEYENNAWFIKDTDLVLIPEKNIGPGEDIFELKGDKQIKLFPGKRLEYEAKNDDMIDKDYITAVEFSANYPYGKALALLGLKSGIMKVNEGWFALQAIVLALIITELLIENEEGSGTSILNETAAMASWGTNLADMLASYGAMAPRCKTSIVDMFAGNAFKKARCLATAAGIEGNEARCRASLAGFKARCKASVVADGNAGNGGNSSARCKASVVADDVDAKCAAMARCKASVVTDDVGDAKCAAMARCRAAAAAAVTDVSKKE